MPADRPSLQELAVGYMSAKLLLKLDAITYILQHHASENFAFLDDPANSRNRSTFYTILARLLFMEDTSAKFKAFVAPLQQVCCSYWQYEPDNDPASPLKDEAIGL